MSRSSDAAQSAPHGAGFSAQAPFQTVVGNYPRELGTLRRRLEPWLEGTRLGEQGVDDMLLAASEACMNAIEHSGAARSSAVHVQARVRGGDLTLVVADAGRWRPTTPEDRRGYGLKLMRAVSDSLDVASSPLGTVVTMRRSVSRAAA